MTAKKCFTKKNKNGGSYTTCVDKKGDQLREKDVKVKDYKKVAKATKKYEAKQTKKDTSQYKKVLSATKKYNKKQDSKDVDMYKKMVARMKAKPLMNVSANMSAISSSSVSRVGEMSDEYLERLNGSRRIRERKHDGTATGNDRFDAMSTYDQNELLRELMN
tara:strand:- start:10 stop:495 length:486 start_codon:yes stop_codon:yes gene_type:complete